MSTNDEQLARAVAAARGGDLAAFARLVELTETMAYAVALGVLRKDADAKDAVQEGYLTAFRRLPELLDEQAFAGWLRRIVVSTSLNQLRRNRTTWLPLTEDRSPPILDDEEERWSAGQQRLLARALLTLSASERRICELHYHGGWTSERLAREAGVEPAAMRKRLQRLRDKLREEIEMDEQRSLTSHAAVHELPAKISELLARPRLVDIPETRSHS